jgi:S1-C subfamily serine protease
MSRLVLTLALWLSVAVGMWVVTTSPSSAAGPFETSSNVRWIIYASRQNIDEAIGLARRFGSEFGQPTVISTTNGWYAIAAGPLSVPDPVAMKKKLSESWWPPTDTFFSKGQTFIAKVWESPKSPILASASSSEKGPHVASAAGLVVRIEASNGRKAVRVRSGQVVASATFDDDGPYNSTAATIASLDSSSAFPQVVATHYTGGAHCCTDMKVLNFVEGRWEVVNVGEFDSDGPQIEDLNGDGSVELVGKDDSFDYAFASYAETYAPPKIFRLIGNRIKDVSNSSEFQRPILQMLLANQGLATPDMWRDNGFLAGWVAHNAMVGTGAGAWRKMLDLYNRNSDWDLSVCTVSTKGVDPCPEYAKRFRDFPTALLEHLAKNGYSLYGIVASSPPAPQATPPSPAPVVAKTTEEPTAPPKPQHEGSSGTGFFVSTDGVVITNAHVVEDCLTVRATTSEGASAAAKVLARDVRNDLAVLNTGLAVNKVAAFRATARLGEAVEAFGYPLTDVLSKSGNFTLGNVSALVGIGEDSRYLQISAPVQPGNSGGPLLDQNGNLVGVVSAKLNALKLMLATNGDIPQNVNFAIKSSIVTNFLDTNGASYTQGTATQPMQPADLAELAKAMSVFIECE